MTPPLDKALAQTLVLNLRNRLRFTAADDEDAEEVTRRIGKRKKKKTNWSYGKEGNRRNVSEEDEFIVPPKKNPKTAETSMHPDPRVLGPSTSHSPPPCNRTDANRNGIAQDAFSARWHSLTEGMGKMASFKPLTDLGVGDSIGGLKR